MIIQEDDGHHETLTGSSQTAHKIRALQEDTNDEESPQPTHILDPTRHKGEDATTNDYHRCNDRRSSLLRKKSSSRKLLKKKSSARSLVLSPRCGDGPDSPMAHSSGTTTTAEDRSSPSSYEDTGTITAIALKNNTTQVAETTTPTNGNNMAVYDVTSPAANKSPSGEADTPPSSNTRSNKSKKSKKKDRSKRSGSRQRQRPRTEEECRVSSKRNNVDGGITGTQKHSDLRHDEHMLMLSPLSTTSLARGDRDNNDQSHVRHLQQVRKERGERPQPRRHSERSLEVESDAGEETPSSRSRQASHRSKDTPHKSDRRRRRRSERGRGDDEYEGHVNSRDPRRRKKDKKPKKSSSRKSRSSDPDSPRLRRRERKRERSRKHRKRSPERPRRNSKRDAAPKPSAVAISPEEIAQDARLVGQLLEIASSVGGGNDSIISEALQASPESLRNGLLRWLSEDNGERPEAVQQASSAMSVASAASHLTDTTVKIGNREQDRNRRPSWNLLTMPPAIAQMAEKEFNHLEDQGEMDMLGVPVSPGSTCGEEQQQNPQVTTESVLARTSSDGSNSSKPKVEVDVSDEILNLLAASGANGTTPVSAGTSVATAQMSEPTTGARADALLEHQLQQSLLQALFMNGGPFAVNNSVQQPDLQNSSYESRTSSYASGMSSSMPAPPSISESSVAASSAASSGVLPIQLCLTSGDVTTLQVPQLYSSSASSSSNYDHHPLKPTETRRQSSDVVGSRSRNDEEKSSRVPRTIVKEKVILPVASDITGVGTQEQSLMKADSGGLFFKRTYAHDESDDESDASSSSSDSSSSSSSSSSSGSSKSDDSSWLNDTNKRLQALAAASSCLSPTREGTSQLSGTIFVQTPPRVKKQTKVSFGQVYIRQYERILSDNPAVTHGPSIGIGWNYGKEKVMDIPQADGYLSAEQGPKRIGDDLVLSKEERMEMLQDLGYTKREIASSIRHVVHRKNQRRQTIQNLGTENVHLALEQAASKLRHVLLRSLTINRPPPATMPNSVALQEGGVGVPPCVNLVV